MAIKFYFGISNDVIRSEARAAARDTILFAGASHQPLSTETENDNF